MTLAAEGGITVCDRYPISCLELMDGPQVRRFGTSRNNWLLSQLIRAEEYYHARIADANLLIATPPEQRVIEVAA